MVFNTIILMYLQSLCITQSGFFFHFHGLSITLCYIYGKSHTYKLDYLQKPVYIRFCCSYSSKLYSSLFSAEKREYMLSFLYYLHYFSAYFMPVCKEWLNNKMLYSSVNITLNIMEIIHEFSRLYRITL